MGQAEVMEFLKKYKKSKDFKKQPWLCVKEIYNKLHGTKKASQLGPVTNSVKKLRECGMIKCREMKWRYSNSNRKVFHYQA
jgi:hypothetical protein